MEVYPEELLEGCSDNKESLARIGRLAVLREMRFFGEQTNLNLAKGDYPGSFVAAVRRHFSNTYGDSNGCHPADLEVAAEYLGVFDDIYDIEAVRGDKNGWRKNGEDGS